MACGMDMSAVYVLNLQQGRMQFLIKCIVHRSLPWPSRASIISDQLTHRRFTFCIEVHFKRLKKDVSFMLHQHFAQYP